MDEQSLTFYYCETDSDKVVLQMDEKGIDGWIWIDVWPMDGYELMFYQWMTSLLIFYKWMKMNWCLLMDE
jgi:hypothetical protein